MSADEVFLTGATGFIGGHVLDALLEARARGARAGPHARSAAAPAGVTEVVGDVTRAGAARRLRCAAARALIHTAAAYSFAPAERARIRATNVAGTAGILEAARLAGRGAGGGDLQLGDRRARRVPAGRPPRTTTPTSTATPRTTTPRSPPSAPRWPHGSPRC